MGLAGVKVRIRNLVQCAIWPLGATFVILLFRADIEQLHGLRIRNAVVWGRDFINVWTGGRLALDGKLSALYDPERYRAFQDLAFGTITQHNFSYPPIALFIATPIAGFPYPVAYVLWTMVGGGLFIGAARAFVRSTDGFPVWLVIFTPASLINIWAGHYGFIIGAIWLYAFARVDRAPGRAGVAVSLLAIKPHLALFIPFILVHRKKWTTMAVAAAGVVILIVASGGCFGFDLWRQYVFKVSALQIAMIATPNQFFHTMMPTTTVALEYYPLTRPVAIYGQVATGLYASVMLFIASRRAVPLSELCFPVATATFLTLPDAFNYDMTVACLGFVLLLNRSWEVLGRPERILLVLAFLSPVLTMVLMMFGLPLTPLILMAGLAVQVRHLGKLAGADLSCADRQSAQRVKTLLP